MRSPTIGLALSGDRIATTAWTHPLTPWIAGAGEWEDLQAALVELRDSRKLRAPRAAIALLPPLVHSRLLEFPRLSPEEYARVLTRDAARYFPTGRVTQIAAAEPASGRASSLVLGAAAASDLIAAVVAATKAAGWRLDTIVPAEAAWLAAAGVPRRGRTGVVVVMGEVLAVLQVEGGRLVGLRRLPATGDAPDRIAAGLAEEGMAVLRLADPEASAAAGAVRARGPELLPVGSLVERRQRARRVAARLAVSAAVLLGIAAALDIWGMHRQLAVVSARRAAIHEEVAAALAREDTVESAAERHLALEGADRAAIRWSEVLADFSDSLPRDAYLVAFRGRADSVGLEGLAGHAAGVFAALQHAPRVAGVRADAPIRQEAPRPGRAPVERFAVAVRLAERAP